MVTPIKNPAAGDEPVELGPQRGLNLSVYRDSSLSLQNNTHYEKKSMYFIQYYINNSDNKKIESFEDYLDVLKFIDTNKNFKIIQVYSGILISDKDLRLKVLEDLTAESQKLGLYN